MSSSAHTLRTSPVALGGAGAVDVVFLPIEHEQPYYVVTLSLQQQGGDRTVYPAAHSHDHSLFSIILL